jgi:hypothetical protein
MSRPNCKGKWVTGSLGAKVCDACGATTFADPPKSHRPVELPAWLRKQALESLQNPEPLPDGITKDDLAAAVKKASAELLEHHKDCTCTDCGMERMFREEVARA